jgi:hypothetical protein
MNLALSRVISVPSTRVREIHLTAATSFAIFSCLLTINDVFVSFPTVDINPNGRSYASGAEDGYVRLHLFDKEYLDLKDPVPEEDEEEEDPDEQEAAE